MSNYLVVTVRVIEDDRTKGVNRNFYTRFLDTEKLR